jgi:hypothetical protein
LYDWVFDIYIKVIKFLVKEIGAANRNKTIPLRQAVAYSRVDDPKLISTRQRIPKLGVLIPVRRRKGGGPSKWLEKSDP